MGGATGSRTKWPEEEGKKAGGDRHNGKDDLFISREESNNQKSERQFPE